MTHKLVKYLKLEIIRYLKSLMSRNLEKFKMVDFKTQSISANEP